MVLLLLLFLSARGIAGFWTDYLWFDALGFGGVFSDLLLSRVALAAIFTVIFAVLLCVNLWVADRLAPRFRQPGPEEQFLERYQVMMRGRRVWFARIGVSLLFGFIAGIPVASQWKDWILFTHATSFGEKDPLFGVDVGFYVFRLPFLTFLMDWLFASLVIILIITAVAHYLNGGIRLQVQGRRVTPQVKAHLSVLLALLAILRAAGYWLQRYELLTSTRGFVDGATYTAVKAELPAINLLFLISLLAAVLLLVNIWQRGWRLPIIAVGLWGLVAVVAGTIYPTFVQRFVVQPAESERERPYIERNIAATKKAMNLDEVIEEPYRVDPLDSAELPANADNLQNVRLLDPAIVPDTFKRLQGLRGYYEFNDLDVDRYVLPGSDDAQQVVLAARELNPADLPIETWEGRHLAYTHGYGLAMAPASKIKSDGNPAFINLNVEAAGPDLARPELYYGEQLPGYAVVGTRRDEISLNSETGAEESSRYEGGGGVEMGSFLRRAAFALRFGEWNLFVSNLISSESKILYVRDVIDRVKLLAPFLAFDNDPYPVVTNGQVKWVVDAYTATDRYPYAQMVDTSVLLPGSGLRMRFNYARNSIKAVVDAYDGSVKFYIVDENDPMAKAYQKAFPELFDPMAAAEPGLVEHFRYPEDLFRVQTSVYSRYHIEDPQQFYQRANAWNVAQNPPSTQSTTQTVTETNAAGQVTRTREQRMPPYYTMLRLPGQEDLQFQLVRPFVPFSDRDERKELQAIMTASSDPNSYGQLRVLELDQSPLPEGPAIVDTDIKQTFAAGPDAARPTGVPGHLRRHAAAADRELVDLRTTMVRLGHVDHAGARAALRVGELPGPGLPGELAGGGPGRGVPRQPARAGHGDRWDGGGAAADGRAGGGDGGTGRHADDDDAAVDDRARGTNRDRGGAAGRGAAALRRGAGRARPRRPGRVPGQARRGLPEGGPGRVTGDGGHSDALDDDAARGDGDDRTAGHRQRLAAAGQRASAQGDLGRPGAPSEPGSC